MKWNKKREFFCWNNGIMSFYGAELRNEDFLGKEYSICQFWNNGIT